MVDDDYSLIYYNSQQQLEKVRALLSNGSRQNASRELMLPKSADIAKVISDDPTGDEEELEELPEVNDKKCIMLFCRQLFNILMV